MQCGNIGKRISSAKGDTILDIVSEKLTAAPMLASQQVLVDVKLLQRNEHFLCLKLIYFTYPVHAGKTSRELAPLKKQDSCLIVAVLYHLVHVSKESRVLLCP
jgi:hypothetical protein